MQGICPAKLHIPYSATASEILSPTRNLSVGMTFCGRVKLKGQGDDHVE
jgi:hypothetical protein